MNIEDRIRSRIEAILVNDAKMYAEMRGMADSEEPLSGDVFEEERNLYQRIINNYRSAVSEVNQLLEESVGFLSGFYRVLENIKEKRNLQEIAAQIVDCVLQDFGAEYCSLVFFAPPEGEAETFCVEGQREDRKIIRLHSDPTLLGSAEFEKMVALLTSLSSECVNIPDVYRDSRFNAFDFPSVVRSLCCLPVITAQRTVGALIFSNSLPNFFKDSHIRVLKILASIVAHLRLLTSGVPAPEFLSSPERNLQQKDGRDVFSIILLEFERVDAFQRSTSLDKDSIRGIRKWLVRHLEPKETIIFNGDHELIMFLPDISGDVLPGRVVRLREAFRHWKEEQGDRLRNVRANMGFATCEEGDDLARTLEIASAVMHPELIESQSRVAGM